LEGDAVDELELLTLSEKEMACVAVMLRVAQIAIRETAAEYAGDVPRQAEKLGVLYQDMETLKASGRICARLGIFQK
jgi:hypothetical protein